MEESIAASDIPDLLEFLRPPVRKVYGARLYKVDSELGFHPKLYGHHKRHYPIRLKSQSSTSMILQKTTKIVKNTTLKSCGIGFTPSLRPTECYDPLNPDHKDILQVTVIPKTKRTHQKAVLEPYERSHTNPIIQVTVLPSPSPFKEKKRKHGLHIQTTTSNQESSVKSNLFVVVSRGKKEKLYEVKASGSTADIKRLRKNYTKYDEIDPQQLSQYKNLIKSLNMEKKKRKGKTDTPGKRKEYNIETLVNSTKKTSQKHKYEMGSLINDASGGIDGSVGKSRLQIMGKLGVTTDDKYILDCSATIDGQPIATRCGELERLFTTENVKYADEIETDASELKIETVNCDCQTKTSSYQDFSVQTDKDQTCRSGQNLLKRNGSRSTQVDVLFNQIKRRNKHCQCYESISEAKINSAECPPSPEKETSPCGNALIVISVYPTENKCVLIKQENKSSLFRDIIQTAVQKDITKVESIQINKTNANEKIQDILIEDSAEDQSESCKFKKERDQSPNEKYTNSTIQEIVPKIKPKRDKSPASKLPISKSSKYEPSDKVKSTKKSLRTSSPKRDKSSEPKSPRSKSPTRYTPNIAELDSTRNRSPSPKGRRKEISPPLKIIKSAKPEAASKLKKEKKGKRNKETLHVMDPCTSSTGNDSPYASRRRSISPDNKMGKKNTNCTIIHSDKNHAKKERCSKDSKKNADKVNVNVQDDKKDNRNIENLPDEARVNIPSWQMNSNCKVNKPTFCLSDTGYSNVNVNIHSKHEHYDLIFHQNGSSTDVIVMKLNNNSCRNNSLSLRNHCAEAESTYYQNCPARDEFNSKRSISDSDVASIQATRGTGISLANIRDSIELCHQHEKQSSMRVSHQNHLTNASAYDGTTKHFRGDNCSITDPFERDREIRELLGVTKRQFSYLQSRERTGFGIWNEYEIQYCVLPQRLRKATPSKIQKQKPQEATNEEYFQGSDYKTGCLKSVNTHKSIVITPKQNKAEGDIIMHTPISLSIKDYFRVKKTLQGKVPKNIKKQQRQWLRKKSARHLKTVADSTKANRRDQVTQIEESDKVFVGPFEELVPVATSSPHNNTVELKEDTREKTDVDLQKALIIFDPSTVKEEYPCENVEQDTQNALSALLFGYAFLHRVMASMQQQPQRIASNVGHYNIFRNNIQETASKQNLEETKENKGNTSLNEEKPVSVRMLFKGSNRKRCHTPNLGASAFSLCAETGPNSVKFNKQAPSKNKQKKPFLRRLVSCMLRSSKAAPAAADEARNIAKSVMDSSTCDSYFINTSLGPMEVSSSIYDTTASFYSSHTVLTTLDRGPKKSFFGSMFGLLR